ncbi:MAG: hypothetical protein RL134_1101 [Actinomycetota bacterium]|jgi:hypothetical protein
MGRPIGVTIIGVIVIIMGIASVLTSIFGILNADTRAVIGLGWLIGTLIIGLIYLALAKGLFDGNNFSRLFIGIITVVNLLIGIFQFIFVSGYRWQALVSVLVSLIVLGVLFSRKATLFFTQR